MVITSINVYSLHLVSLTLGNSFWWKLGWIELFTRQAVNRMLEEVRMSFQLLAPCHMQSSFSDEELLWLMEYKDAMVQGESAEFSVICLSCLEHFFTASLYNISLWLDNYPDKELHRFMKLLYHEYNPPDECDWSEFPYIMRELPYMMQVVYRKNAGDELTSMGSDIVLLYDLCRFF